MDPHETNLLPLPPRIDHPTGPEDSSDDGDDFEFSQSPCDPNHTVYPVFNRDVPLFHGEEVPPTAIEKKSRSTGDVDRRRREAVVVGTRSHSDGKAKMATAVLHNGAGNSPTRGKEIAGGSYHGKGRGGGGPQRRRFNLPYRSIFAGLLGETKGCQ